MKKLSFKEAAVRILKDADEPLSAKEITTIALDEELIETSGATPEATMAAQLYTDTGRFKKVGKGIFALVKQKESAKSPLLAIQNQNQLVRERLKEKLHQMDPFQFEFFVAELLGKIGYENVEVTKRSGDKGIDINANLTVGGLTNVKTVVQVKRYKKGNNLAGRHITQLRGSAEVDQRGLIITTSKFTKDAVEESRALNKMPVALVDGEKLIDLLFKYKVAVKEELVSVYSIDSELFENESIESSLSTGRVKSKAIWPLPGGIESYVDTLNQFLVFLSEKGKTKKNIIKWIMTEYENVNSEKTAYSYLNVPRNMGLVKKENGVFSLTVEGAKYLNSQDEEYLYEIISANILAFEEVYQFILNNDRAVSHDDVLEYINENFDVQWSTIAQVRFRLIWLMNLGKISRSTEGYYPK